MKFDINFFIKFYYFLLILIFSAIFCNIFAYFLLFHRVNNDYNMNIME